MELVYGSEISFSDGFAFKPARTFVTPLSTITSAKQNHQEALPPSLTAQITPIESSCGVPSGKNSTLKSAPCTSIIPGTSIAIFDEGIMCIVVPTASAIHRFYARLPGKGRDTFSILARIKEDEEFRRFHTSHALTTPGRPIRANVTHHPSRNTVSYVTSEGQLVVVSLASYTDPTERHEEFVIGEVGLLGKLLGGTDKRVADACVMKNLRPTNGVSRERQVSAQSDIVFAVTRDGWVQAWNVETKKQLPCSIDLNKFFAADNKSFLRRGDAPEMEEEEDISQPEPSELFYSIKAYTFDIDSLLIVGCDVLIGGKSVGMRVHLLKFSNDNIEHMQMFETIIGLDERLLDYELIQTYFPPDDVGELDATADDETYNPRTSALFSLTALLKSSSSKKSYSMKRLSFAIQWKTAEVFTEFDWHTVHQFNSASGFKGEPVAPNNEDEMENVPERPYNLSADSSTETLIDVVFNTDLYAFDIVFRAVQIVTDNFRGALSQVRSNNWSDLSKLVDTYTTSVEFNRKFHQKTDRGIRLRLNAPQENESTALRDFWWSLLRACEELDFAARGIISLSPMQISGDLKIMTVIHKDRMTIIGDNNTEFMDIISTENIPKPGYVEEKYRKLPNVQFVDLIEEASKFADRRVYLMNRERARSMSAKNGVPLVDEDGAENAFDYDNDGRFINVKSALEQPIIKLTAAFVQASTFDNPKPFENPSQDIFGGTFAQSIVSANIRVTVESRNKDANDYLRCLVDYEGYAVALQVLGEIVEQETLQLSQPNVRTWLPYGIIDELMIRSMFILSSDTDEDEGPPPAKRRSIEGVPKSFDNDRKMRFSFGVSSNDSFNTTTIPEHSEIPTTPSGPSRIFSTSKTPVSLRRRSVSMSCMTPIVEAINEPPKNLACSSFVQNHDDREEDSDEEEEGMEEKKMEEDLNLRALLSPEKNNKKRKEKHNGGRFKGGAKKTDSRGPWDIVCVVHGFPNHVAALRFEGAWQNPAVSKSLKEKQLKKERKETPFAYQKKNSHSHPDVLHHVKLRYGKVKKEMSLVPAEAEDYVKMGECRLCGEDIEKLWSLVRCISATWHAHFHSKCLAAHGLKAKQEYSDHIFPLKANCPTCGHVYLWGDIVREQRRIMKVSTKCAEEFRTMVVRKDLPHREISPFPSKK
ncbi:hypothetical protein CAEBREN_14278 [Caenorhabditis brenneri]|uniref:Uncharacterized protein n=1 Tax=Caenorhabditis brenneri TaxID=135651 RepID=G0PBW6_CAEBE|nr:hypothetical protein CAEBREN_14278 [Caenorhabditis brenneri]